MLRPWNLDLKIDEKYFQLPVYQQIVETVIDAVHSGKLKRGNVLPGTRKLADMLQVNRNTVIEAYNQLEYKGWVTSKQRSGTFVSFNLPHIEAKEVVTDHAKSISAINKIVFDQGLPDTNLSPMEDIIREYKLVLKKIQKQKLHTFNDPAGYRKLRVVLSQMLNHQRRIAGDENNICITRGSQMALFMISQCLLKSGDCVIVEHPGYRLAWDAFEYAGAKVLFAEVDTDGIVISDIKKYIEMGMNIKAVYVSPNSQFPTTAILSEPRRKELIELSNAHDFYIIEDDYCTDINYSEKRLLPLCSDENLKNYIYVGTFSRSVSPFLKIGYVASSHTLIKKLVALRRIIDINGDSIMERAFFNLIRDGIYTKHLKKSVRHYKNKRDFLDEILNKYLNGKIRYTKPELGLGYWITPVKPMREEFNRFLKDELATRGIRSIISHDYYKNDGEGVLVSFGSVSEKNLEEAVKIMAEYF
ncbi:PLP-dependent aminotransferase family protein [Chryseobacterium sp. OV279]|uniref:MocR-like pyridoxine biosynthesis transcription factor PdxR n=1 Tax=Chryseobacterium sp. OV279 TaxID=1500285 RepID=UPI000919ED17|nr:PLP-dependent aminotransferase family protein [Chryseobacterium sp. OV279]SHF89219.1 GntR family transcriptional regulator / MocR family aminotransferase [Chryseobacterium sp. OV279]